MLYQQPQTIAYINYSLSKTPSKLHFNGVLFTNQPNSTEQQIEQQHRATNRTTTEQQQIEQQQIEQPNAVQVDYIIDQTRNSIMDSVMPSHVFDFNFTNQF